MKNQPKTREELLETAKAIPVNAEVARAYLNGKTQTRRIINLSFDPDNINIVHDTERGGGVYCVEFENYDTDIFKIIKPKYRKEDILWIREPAEILEIITTYKYNHVEEIEFKYKADSATFKTNVPDRFFTKMGFPKWLASGKGIPNGCIKEMARMFHRVVDVRVERLQDISEEDCLAEGIYKKEVYSWGSRGGEYPPMPTQDFAYTYDGDTGYSDVKDCFAALWNSTAPKGYKWEDNPFVFVYETEEIK